MENLNKESKPYLSGESDDNFTASKTENLTNEEAVAYSQSYLKDLDNQSVIRFTAQKSREEGREEGIIAGTLKIAENMLRRGMSVSDVAAFTELTIPQILDLQKSFK